MITATSLGRHSPHLLATFTYQNRLYNLFFFFFFGGLVFHYAASFHTDITIKTCRYSITISIENVQMSFGSISCDIYNWDTPCHIQGVKTPFQMKEKFHAKKLHFVELTPSWILPWTLKSWLLHYLSPTLFISDLPFWLQSLGLLFGMLVYYVMPDISFR